MAWGMACELNDHLIIDPNNGIKNNIISKKSPLKIIIPSDEKNSVNQQRFHNNVHAYYNEKLTKEIIDRYQDPIVRVGVAFPTAPVIGLGGVLIHDGWVFLGINAIMMGVIFLFIPFIK
jgi:hypothetical protein